MPPLLGGLEERQQLSRHSIAEFLELAFGLLLVGCALNPALEDVDHVADDRCSGSLAEPRLDEELGEAGAKVQDQEIGECAHGYPQGALGKILSQHPRI